MANIAKQVLDKMGVTPRLRLAEQITDENGKRKGVKSTGPHRVILGPSSLAKDLDPETGHERQIIQYEVREAGLKKIWNVPIRNKKGEPNYLVERMADIQEGEEIILESKRAGARNYTSITRVNGSTDIEDDDEHITQEEMDAAVDAADKENEPYQGQLG
jgi:hypothetical protein